MAIQARGKLLKQSNTTLLQTTRREKKKKNEATDATAESDGKQKIDGEICRANQIDEESPKDLYRMMRTLAAELLHNLQSGPSP